MDTFKVIDLIQKKAIQPENIIIEEEGRPSLSWSRLYQHLLVVVEQLKKLGLKHQDRIGLVLENGAEMATCFLATASSFTCVPLNPYGKEYEFIQHFSHVDIQIVIIQQDLYPSARKAATTLNIPIIDLIIDSQNAAGIFYLNGNPITSKHTKAACQLTEKPALILSTSGTTSLPKIVALSEQHLCISARNLIDTFALNSFDKCLNVMPLYHIHGIMVGIMAPIVSGGSVVYLREYSEKQFFKILHTAKPTWYSAVPTIHQLVLSGVQDHQETVSQHSLRFIRSSSAALPAQIAQELEAVFQVPVCQAYGMTEATHQIASNPLPPAIRKANSVGLATGAHIAIVNEQGYRLPCGEVGEVLIKGDHIISHYVSITHASNNQGFHKGWLKTGDLGYIDEEGYLFLIGRSKEMINRGGEKIAPQEIDNILLQHPDIAQAVTFSIPHEILGENVACAVVLKPASNITVKDITQFVAKQVAYYKVPYPILLVNNLPKTASGKLKRIGLANEFKLQLQAVKKTTLTS